MYRKILVAYNGTPESRLALDEAIHFAPDASVEVHLAGVVHYPSAYLLAENTWPEVALADERDTWKPTQGCAALLAGNGLTVIDHLLVGEPVDVLTKLVAELRHRSPHSRPSAQQIVRAALVAGIGRRGIDRAGALQRTGRRRQSGAPGALML
jgi:nucleotide-binding universal stress UspA family protein